MSPGITEEAGSTTRQLISSLSTTPMILALVVFNLFYIGVTTYLQIKQGERFTESQQTWERMVDKALSSCSGGTPTPH